MKKFKAYFKMMITAVIYLAMSLIPGKKKGQAVLAFSQGQGGTGTNKNEKAFLKTNKEMQETTVSAVSAAQKKVIDFQKVVSAHKQRLRQQSFQRYVFVPTVGPGDQDEKKREEVLSGLELLLREESG